MSHTVTRSKPLPVQGVKPLTHEPAWNWFWRHVTFVAPMLHSSGAAWCRLGGILFPEFNTANSFMRNRGPHGHQVHRSASGATDWMRYPGSPDNPFKVDQVGPGWSYLQHYTHESDVGIAANLSGQVDGITQDDGLFWNYETGGFWRLQIFNNSWTSDWTPPADGDEVHKCAAIEYGVGASLYQDLDNRIDVATWTGGSPTATINNLFLGTHNEGGNNGILGGHHFVALFKRHVVTREQYLQWLGDPWGMFREYRPGMKAAAGGPELLSVSGALTSAGALLQIPQLEHAGTLTSSGLAVKEPQIIPEGLLDFEGAHTSIRTLLLAVAGVLTLAGVAIKEAQLELAGTLTSSGTLGNVTVRLLAVAGSLTMAGANILQPQINPAGTLTSSGAAVKEPQIERSGTLTSSGVAIKEPQIELAGTLTSSGVVASVRVALLAVAGVLTMAGAAVKRPLLELGGTLTSSGTETKLVGQVLGGVLTTSGVAIKLVSQTLVGVLALAGTMSTALAAVLVLFPPNVVDAPARRWKVDAPARTSTVDDDD